jgi:hypothetical protein
MPYLVLRKIMDIARKNELLQQHGLGPLTELGRNAVRCAECILARPPIYGEEGEPPSFTVPDIKRCQGEGAVHAIKLLRAANLVTVHPMPPQRLYPGGNPPLLFRPRSIAGEQFFTPDPLDGCVRTAQGVLIETLKPYSQRVVLQALVRLSTSDISLPSVRAETGLNKSTVVAVINFFMQRSVLEPLGGEQAGDSDQSYSLTGMGEWLVQGLSVLTPVSSKPAKPKSLPTMSRAEILPGKGRRVPPWVAKRVEQQYADKGTKINQSIVQLLDDGILEETTASNKQTGSIGLRDPESGAQIWFTPVAALNLKIPGQMALAYWLKLGPLLYGQELAERDVRQLLQVPKAELNTHIREFVYRPLVRLLNDENDVDGA